MMTLRLSVSPAGYSQRPVADSTCATDLETKDSLAFIEAYRRRPLFVYVAYSAIHFPWMTADDDAQRLAGVRNQVTSGEHSKLGSHTGDMGAAVAPGNAEDRKRSAGIR